MNETWVLARGDDSGRYQLGGTGASGGPGGDKRDIDFGRCTMYHTQCLICDIWLVPSSRNADRWIIRVYMLQESMCFLSIHGTFELGRFTEENIRTHLGSRTTQGACDMCMGCGRHGRRGGACRASHSHWGFSVVLWRLAGRCSGGRNQI